MGTCDRAHARGPVTVRLPSEAPARVRTMPRRRRRGRDAGDVLGDHGWLMAVCRTHWSGPTARADPAAEVEAELLSTYGVELLPIEQLSGGLRARPVRITRPSAPAATSIETRRVQVGRLMIGLVFVQAISALMQPALDASVVQTDVTSSPPALVSPSRSGQPWSKSRSNRRSPPALWVISEPGIGRETLANGVPYVLP